MPSRRDHRGWPVRPGGERHPGAALTLDPANGTPSAPAPADSQSGPVSGPAAARYALQRGPVRLLYVQRAPEPVQRAQYTDDTPRCTTSRPAPRRPSRRECPSASIATTRCCRQVRSTTCARAQIGWGRRHGAGGARPAQRRGRQRTDEFRHDSYRVVLGVKGEIMGRGPTTTSWCTAGSTHTSACQRHFPTRLANALNVVSVGGVPTCQSVVDASDPAAYPTTYSAGGVTPAALNYITEAASVRIRTTTIVNAQVVGDLPKYGIKSPLVNKGFGWRGRRYRDNRSKTTRTRPIARVICSPPERRIRHGTYRVGEVFTELRVPLIEDQPFAKRDAERQRPLCPLHPAGQRKRLRRRPRVGADRSGPSARQPQPRGARAERLRVVPSQVLSSKRLPTRARARLPAPAGRVRRHRRHRCPIRQIPRQTSINVVTGGNPT